MEGRYKCVFIQICVCGHGHDLTKTGISHHKTLVMGYSFIFLRGITLVVDVMRRSLHSRSAVCVRADLRCHPQVTVATGA